MYIEYRYTMYFFVTNIYSVQVHDCTLANTDVFRCDFSQYMYMYVSLK